jgi:glutathione synthase/RimK-type ligase-like ATP-grasp enzyme
MLIEGKGDRWHRHADNSVFILENNELFDKPSNWDDIVESCVNALKAIGLDIACFDVKVQKNNVDYPKYILLESNSAPCLKDVGIQAYKKQLIKIINGRYRF